MNKIKLLLVSFIVLVLLFLAACGSGAAGDRREAEIDKVLEAILSCNEEGN